jgi:hypothetical protein
MRGDLVERVVRRFLAPAARPMPIGKAGTIWIGCGGADQTSRRGATCTYHCA